MFNLLNASIAHAYYRSKPVWVHYQSMLESQHLPHTALRQLQLQKVQKLAQSAHQKFPFWQGRFQTSGFLPQSLQSLEDLQRWPLLQKEDLPRILGDGQLATEGLLPQRSGGSTGKPVTIYVTPQHLYWVQACVLRFYHWMGYKLGQRRAKLFAAPTRTGIPELTFRNKLRNRLGNLLFLDVLNLTPQRIEEIELQLNAFQPRMIMGYASRMDLFASHLLNHGRTLKLDDVLIMNAAETAPPDLRERVARAFNGRFFDHYGTREVGQIADEIVPGQGLLVHMECMLVEIVHPDGSWVKPGEEGEIVVTQLENYGMPILRYRVGDRAVRVDETGVGGTGLQIIPAVLSRVDDVIMLPSGVPAPQFAIRHVIKDFPVSEFQVIQYQPTATRVLVVLHSVQDQSCLPQMRHALQNLLVGMDVDIKVVNDIPPAPSGKKLSVVNYQTYQAIQAAQ